MAHFLQYRLGPADDGKEVLFLMQKVLGLTTKKVRSVKHEERGILLDEERVTVRARGKKGCVYYLPERKNHFCQIQNSCGIRDSRFAMKRTTGFSYGICHLQQMRLCLNLRNVPDIPISRRRAMFYIIPASVRLMRNMFRL